MRYQDTAETGAPVLLERRGAVARLRLARPSARNALSLALMTALEAALEEADRAEGVRAIIIAADGPVFSSGHDLREMAARRGDPDHGEAFFTEVFSQCSRLMHRIQLIGTPVIAEVQGLATAAGCQLVAACDLALAGASARFATPGVDIGLFCSTPMVALSRNVGRKAALGMLLTGEAIPAEEALRIGLVNKVVPDAVLADAALELAERIASKPARTMRLGKRTFYTQAELPTSSAYDLASAVMVRNMLGADALEGIDAFLAKRRPDWRQ